MRLTESQLSKIREKPQSTRLNLFMFQPRTIMKARINNASIAKGARTIAYDTVTLGDYSAVEANMTMLVGTTDGGSELGKIRIKSATSSTFTVAQNSHVRWADDAYITVLRYVDIWPVFPKAFQDPSNDENVLFYKDYDVSYSNQNSTLGTFVNMGSHRPVFLENSTGTVYYSSTGTYNLLQEAVTYDWAFEGGLPTGSTSATPGNVRYTTTGDYVTRLKVTSASGAIDTSYRYVCVRNKIGEGSNTPIVRWEMDDLSGSRDEAGYSVTFKVYDDIRPTDNAIVMLYADDLYGSTNVSYGGYPNSEKIFFVGYIDGGSIRYDYQHSYYEFRAVSVTEIMKKFTSFSASVTSTSNPNYWYQLLDMDIRRALYHYLRWHTTVLNTTDVQFVGTDYKLQYFDFDRTSLFDAIQSLVEGRLNGSVSADRQGRIWAEVDPVMYDNPTGTFIPVMDITKRDWIGEPEIEERYNDEVSYMEHGGVAYSGSTTGTFEAFLTGAPGTAPSYSGGIEKLTGLAVASQTHLNTVAGHIWANKNQRYPFVSMDMSENLRNLDIAPMETVSLKINSGDTVRRVAIDGLYIPSSISWNYDHRNGILLPSIEYRGLVNGVPADTIIIPPAQDFNDDYNFDYDFNVPTIDIPPDVVITTPGANGVVVIVVENKGVFYTNDFKSASPTWMPFNVGLPGTNIVNLEITKSGVCYCQAGNVSIHRAEYPGAVWTKVLEVTHFGAFDENDPGIFQGVEAESFMRGEFIDSFGIDRDANDSILVYAGFTASILSQTILYPFYGTAGVFTRMISNTYWADDGGYNTRSFLSARGSTGAGWLWTRQREEDIGSSDGNGLYSIITSTYGEARLAYGLKSSVTTKSAIQGKSKDNQLLAILKGSEAITYDGGTTWIAAPGIAGAYTVISPASNTDRFQSIAPNKDASVILMGTSSGAKVSTNQGVSFDSYVWVSGTASTAAWNLGDNEFAYAETSNMWYTSNPHNANKVVLPKTGNLNNVVLQPYAVTIIRSN